MAWLCKYIKKVIWGFKNQRGFINLILDIVCPDDKNDFKMHIRGQSCTRRFGVRSFQKKKETNLYKKCKGCD